MLQRLSFSFALTMLFALQCRSSLALFWAVSYAAVTAVGKPAGPRDLSQYRFEEYTAEFRKTYTRPADLAQRRELFEATLARIIDHNAEYSAGHHGWWMDVNQLTDWTPAELKGLRSAHVNSDLWNIGEPWVDPGRNTTNPSRVDWRERNVVTLVNDQGSCGSCWAFSAAEALESYFAISSGKLLELSPQAVLACTKNPSHCGGTGGCGGGTLELAFNYTMGHGLPLKSDMPYLRRTGICRQFRPIVKNSGFVKLPSNDAQALERAVATKGPVSVIVAALTWQVYGGGIFRGCSAPLPDLGNELDHAVQVVGYGVDEGQRYWLVRNSWGKWGEGGYIRITRDNDDRTFKDDDPGEGVACKPYPKTQTVGGECGILFDASYPTGVTAAFYDVLV